MSTYERLQSEKKQTRHWLHIIAALLTGGLWLPGYLLVHSSNARHNAMVDVKMMGALAAMQDGGK